MNHLPDFFVGNTLQSSSLGQTDLEQILDDLQGARVNRIMFISHDPWGASFEQDPSFYAHTFLKPFREPGSLRYGDPLRSVCRAAEKRGMGVYAHLLPYDSIESGVWPTHRAEETNDVSSSMQPRLSACAQIDLFGRKDGRTCWRHPDYRQYQLAVAENLLRGYPIEGIKYNVECTGPLSSVLIGRDAAGFRGRRPRLPTCFCDHCLAEASRRGIQVDRARRGWKELLELSERSWRQARHAGDPFATPGVAMGDGREVTAPPDGYFIGLLRILFRYPELLQWNSMWYDGIKSLYAEMHGLVKNVHPDRKLGLHVWHHRAFSPFDRAVWDYAELAKMSDWIKPKVDHRTAGFRYHQDVRRWSQALFGGQPIEEAYRTWCALLGWKDEAPYDELPTTGMSLNYVRREVLSAVEAVPEGFPIYPGISVGIPSPTLTSTPDSIRDGIRVSCESGAAGIMLCRGYHEQGRDQLLAAGKAIDEALAQRKSNFHGSVTSVQGK